MTDTAEKTTVSLRKDLLDIPVGFADRARQILPGEAIEVSEASRNKRYNQAKMAVRDGTWKTRKVDNKVYLIRMS
jgi:hypothetical protein